MESDDLIYRKLQRHLDRMPVGFPESKSGKDISILRELFTPEEAAIALELSMLPEPLSKIFHRVKHLVSDEKTLENRLDSMKSRGLIMGRKKRVKTGSIKFYSNAQFAIGIYEMQLNRMSSGLAENFVSYFKNDYPYEFIGKKNIPQVYTIPIQQSIKGENSVSTYDNIREIIGRADGPIAQLKCICKQTHDLAGEPCKTTELRETCFLLRSIAKQAIASGTGREITKDEFFRQLDVFEKEGLVVQPQNSMEPMLICFCCGCCCGVLNLVKKFPKPTEYYKSNYFASVDSDKCAGCGTCTTRCQMGAISLVEEKAVVDLDRCIGCGLCTATCKTGAVILNRRRDAVTPPKNNDELYQTILVNKIGRFAAVKTMIKYKLGMKV